MGLIEKAIQAAEEAEETRQDEDRESLGALTPSSKVFDLDSDYLASQGFLTPGSSAPIAYEMRAIKRRLLRRMGFLKAPRRQDRMFGSTARQRNLILVTSTRASEGKTFVACNLALSMAGEDEMEVLLVDADAPRPKVRTHFGLDEAPGLMDALVSPHIAPEMFIQRASQLPLSILPEGEPTDLAAEMFGSVEAQRLFSHLSCARQDRFVVIDAPPVLATTEAVLLARHVDEIVFVVEADATPEPAVAAALDELAEVNPNISLVLNRCLLTGGGAHYGSYERYGKKAE